MFFRENRPGSAQVIQVFRRVTIERVRAPKDSAVRHRSPRVRAGASAFPRSPTRAPEVRRKWLILRARRQPMAGPGRL